MGSETKDSAGEHYSIIPMPRISGPGFQTFRPSVRPSYSSVRRPSATPAVNQIVIELDLLTTCTELLNGFDHFATSSSLARRFCSLDYFEL